MIFVTDGDTFLGPYKFDGSEAAQARAYLATEHGSTTYIVEADTYEEARRAWRNSPYNHGK